MGVTICLPCAETSGIKILKLHFVLENLYCNPPRVVHLKNVYINKDFAETKFYTWINIVAVVEKGDMKQNYVTA